MIAAVIKSRVVLNNNPQFIEPNRTHSEQCLSEMVGVVPLTDVIFQFLYSFVLLVPISALN